MITGSKAPEPLAGPFGGILADEMGLGKTLTTLATITSTLDNAKSWLLSKPSENWTRQRSKATVIVVPSESELEPDPHT
jgi:SNF2 family DNA or RNA helicase